MCVTHKENTFDRSGPGIIMLSLLTQNQYFPELVCPAIARRFLGGRFPMNNGAAGEVTDENTIFSSVDGVPVVYISTYRRVSNWTALCMRDPQFTNGFQIASVAGGLALNLGNQNAISRDRRAYKSTMARFYSGISLIDFDRLNVALLETYVKIHCTGPVFLITEIPYPDTSESKEILEAKFEADLAKMFPNCSNRIGVSIIPSRAKCCVVRVVVSPLKSESPSGPAAWEIINWMWRKLRVILNDKENHKEHVPCISQVTSYQDQCSNEFIYALDEPYPQTNADKEQFLAKLTASLGSKWGRTVEISLLEKRPIRVIITSRPEDPTHDSGPKPFELALNKSDLKTRRSTRSTKGLENPNENADLLRENIELKAEVHNLRGSNRNLKLEIDQLSEENTTLRTALVNSLDLDEKDSLRGSMQSLPKDESTSQQESSFGIDPDQSHSSHSDYPQSEEVSSISNRNNSHQQRKKVIFY